MNKEIRGPEKNLDALHVLTQMYTSGACDSHSNKCLMRT